jgi:hypothetical protein
MMITNEIVDAHFKCPLKAFFQILLDFWGGI